jgi:hypothetical protein
LQAPLSTRTPFPTAIDPEAAAAGAAVVAGGGGATVDAGGGGGGAADAGAPPVMGEAVPVPFCWIASCLKSAWVLLAVGLIENVIPCPQWPACLQ